MNMHINKEAIWACISLCNHPVSLCGGKSKYNNNVLRVGFYQRNGLTNGQVVESN